MVVLHPIMEILMMTLKIDVINPFGELMLIHYQKILSSYKFSNPKAIVIYLGGVLSNIKGNNF